MYGLFRVCGIKLTRFGSNFNKRFYVGIVWGSYPTLPFTDLPKPHPKYPWWRSKIRVFNGTLSNLTSEKV